MRKEIEVEWRSNELLEKFFRQEKENENFRIELAQKELDIADKEQTIADQAQALVQKDIDTVISAYKEGIPNEMIVKITGLTHDEIKKILENHKKT